MSTHRLGRTVLLALVVVAGVVSLSGTSALAFFGHPLLSQITQAPEGTPLVKPSELTFDATGNLFLDDRGHIDVFNAANTFQGALGAGTVTEFGSPSVAVDRATGDVYVADFEFHKVFVFKPAGAGKYTLLSAWSGKNSPGGSFGFGYLSVAIDNSTSASDPHAGDVYVLYGSAIEVFKPKPPGAEEAQEGEWVGKLTTTGFSLPLGGVGAAVDASTGALYIPDEGNKAVDEFNGEGTFTQSFKGPGESFAPVAVGIEESTHNVYVVDSAEKQVDEFDKAGKLIGGTFQPFLVEPLGVAVNSSGKVYVSDGGSEPRAVDILGPAVLLPDVTTGAGEVKQVSVTFEGVVNPDGEAVTGCRFEYGTKTSYGQTAPCSPAPGSGSSPVPVVSAEIGLEPNTTYHFRLTAENTSGATHGGDKTVTTKALAPELGLSSVSAITRVSATVSAKINPENNPTTYRILYGETSSYGEHSPEFLAGGGFGEVTVHIGLLGFVPSMTYHYAVVASNKVGTVTGPDRTFTTAAPTPPTAATGGASNVALTTATVSGTIDPEGLETSYELDLGTDATYGTSIYGEAGSGTVGINIEVALKYLAPGTTYHYRLVAINSDGKTYGADETFTTPAYSAPIVVPFALPLLQTPAIAFPTESGAPIVKKTHKKARHGKHRGRGGKGTGRRKKK